MSSVTSAPRTARWAASATAAVLLAGGFIAATPAASQAASEPVVVAGMALDDDGAAIVTDVEHTLVAPGLEHVSFERLDAAGWLQVNVLKAELSDTTVRADYIGPETISAGATVTEMADRAGAVAAVNGDFYDINNSWAPAGFAISAQDGLLKSANPGRGRSVAFGEDGLGHITRLLLQGTVELPGGSAPLAGVNLYAMPAGGVTVYTSQWGEYTRARTLAAGESGVEVLLDAEGRVTAVGTPGEGRLPDGVQAVVARPGAAADALAALEVGEEVAVSYTLDQDDVAVAIGGQVESEAPVLTDGVVGTGNSAYRNTRHPRTAVGFSEDGATAYLVVADGRQATSRGLSLSELGKLMLDLGAHDALNVDGGGSSQLNAREPGTEGTTVRNSPADLSERENSNGLGLFLSVPGSGDLTGFRVERLANDDADRVFPGLRRTLRAHGHDETLSPVAGSPQTWTSSAPAATVSDGVVVGQQTGRATITAATGAATGETQVEVLGPLTRLTASQSVITLEAEGSTAEIAVTGHDAEGFTAPVEAPDVTVTNPDPETFGVTPTQDGTFLVTATGVEGAARLTFAVGEATAEVVVAVPLELRVIDDFSQAQSWTSAHDRAAGGTVSPGEGHAGGEGLRLTYDFAGSTGTRGQYAVAPGGGIEIPGRPQKLSLWVNGTGKGELLRLQVRQANGQVAQLDGPGGSQSLFATWEGWQRVDFIVPPSLETPLTLQRIRVLETDALKQYTGEIGVSELSAYLPPENVPAPAEQRVTDPIVVATGETDDDELRVAVVSDAQFVARNPSSGAVEGARDAFREVVAEDPDLLIINGDLVDEAAPADFDLARRIIDEELGEADFPWYYVPGNHEIMGGPIGNFIEEFGDTTNVVDMNGTRIITLNSATARLGGDFAQVRMLRDQLDAAAEDDSVSGVLVVMHHPTNDPLPTKNSQLTDRHEAAMVDGWLADWRADSGKSVALVAAHVGIFHSSHLDGVPYVINGNAGKGPSSTPANGGFTGWTMLGVNPGAGHWGDAPTDGEDWISVEVQTRVDELAIIGPRAPLGAGEQVTLDAQVTQDDTRTFDLSWPMSWSWSGSDGVFVGDFAEAPGDAVAALDPVTGVLTGLRAGSGDVTLAVNDATRTVTVEVTGGQVAVAGEAAVGNDLTADLSGWGLADDATVTFQWLRDGEEIDDATGRRYSLTPADHNAEITVRVSVAASGLATVSATSTPIGPVAAGQLPTDVEVSVTGEPVVGQTLEAGVFGLGGVAAELTYRWLRDGVVVADAGTASYVLAPADEGARMAVEMSITAAGYEPLRAFSTPTEPVRAAEVPTEPSRGAEFHLSNDWRGSTDVYFMYGRYTDEVLIGDWDGDGVDTIAVRRDNMFHVSNAQRGGDADVVLRYGRPGDVVLVGDWDGDGLDTFAVRRGNEYHVRNSLRGGGADVVIRYGRADDAVMVGDWDGNGTDTLAVRRADEYHVRNTISAGEADRVFRYGRAGDTTLAGDWDGNGTDTLAVQRGRTYHVRNSLRGGEADVVVTYGRIGDEVHVGDWDGNGTDTLGVRRPAGGAIQAATGTATAVGGKTAGG